jgi:hypothetical protein
MNITTEMDGVTTVQIYRIDLKKLEQMCKKGEYFRDKIHEILEKFK